MGIQKSIKNMKVPMPSRDYHCFNICSIYVCVLKKNEFILYILLLPNFFH